MATIDNMSSAQRIKYIKTEIKKYFNIKELVCPDVYKKFGEGAWMFIDDRLIETIFILRTQILGVPMTINNWHAKGSFSQRGLRCNRCQIVRGKTAPYLSAHVMGKAIDFDAKGMTAEQVRKTIKSNIDLLPYPIRLEEGVNWVHIDVYDGGSKLTTFRV